jgi:ubiquinone/menaquinone biosynthesis C-methylase UbiE
MQKSRKIARNYLASIGVTKRSSEDTYSLITNLYSPDYPSLIEELWNDFLEGKIEVRAFYDQVALVYLYLQSRAYDGIEKRMCYLIEKNLIAPNDRIIDVGCGSGLYDGLLSQMAKNGYVVAIDFSKNMVIEAKKLIEKLKLENVEPLRADVTALPFQDNCFDVAFCMNVLSETDAGKALQELVRTTKEGGKIIIGETVQGSGMMNLTDFLNPLFSNPEVECKELITSCGTEIIDTHSFTYDVGYGELLASDIIIFAKNKKL